MYSPAHFRETDQARLFDLIAAHNFGLLIVPDGERVELAHLPFVLDREAGRLRAHIAKPNRIWELASDGRPVTAVFQGPHGYVSPRWYEQPTRQVPTWNYAVVHVHGRLRGPMPADELHALLVDLSAQHEAGAAEPWQMERLEPALQDSLMRGIVGFSLEVERLEGKFKLSQNRSPTDQARVVEAFAQRGSADDLEMVQLMRR